MTNKLLSMFRIASEVSHDQARDLVMPPDGGNMGHFGVVSHAHPPWLVRLDTGQKVDSPFSTVAVGMAFRPVQATETNGARNQEVAVVYGNKAVMVDFYDITLGEMLPGYAFPRAQSVVYSPVGDKLAVGGSTGQLAVLDLKSGRGRKELFSVSVSKSAIVRLAFTGHGDVVYALTASGEVYAVTMSGKVTQRVFDPHEEDSDFECWAHVLNREVGMIVIAGSCNRQAQSCQAWVIDLQTGQKFAIATGHKRYVRRLQLCGRGQLVVIGDNGAEVYDLLKRQICPMKESGATLQTTYSAAPFGTCLIVIGTSVN